MYGNSKISEKTLQRYIYEILTYGVKEKYLSLFPPKFLHFARKPVKVIIPEYPLLYNSERNKHITDFRIIFDDNTALNIEVEWQVSRFTHGKEVYEKLYAGGKGFVLVINNNRNPDSFIDENDISVVDANDFSFWFLKKAKHIVDGTISNYNAEYAARIHKNWFVFLPASGRNCGDSLNDYTKKGQKNGVWAFRYSTRHKAMKNILDITAGDTIVFVYDFKYGSATRGRQFYYNTAWQFSGLDILKIKNGYYCDLYDSTFETDTWKALSRDEKVHQKEYMHYFRYQFPPAIESEKYFTSIRNPITIFNNSSELPGWLEFIDQLRWSSSTGGAPAELSEEALSALYTILGQHIE
ncbi:MAG: hypothetical protein E7519_06295 [Ruminococcaceae bacterium]|nr:hypothetical protein [Oscillospiraceae bacterium]